VPSRLIHDEYGMCFVVDVAGYLDQVLVHGMGIAPRHDESGGLAVLGADRAENIGRACPLVMGCGWPRSPLGPAAGDLVLLPDTGFILIPDFDHFALGGTCGDLCHCGGEVFLNASAASASRA